ncbi:MAG: hypothetical protein KME32_27195 [Mojavia pulchra JT2-VF2]|jgi:hypothetical protein|uniref:Phasin protein n=1 Tax=Mojavia pulchra JT2-VF2 TaxID=287848 RepID=A0A951Q2I2_9NOST|nr:hypothetical protein [Mojavia pulchra JT2-VF2]
MNAMNNFEQILNQVTEAQRRFFSNWTSMMPGMENFNISNARQSFDDVLKFQEDIVKGSLELQTSLSRLSIETQRKLWDNYFTMMRRG